MEKSERSERASEAKRKKSVFNFNHIDQKNLERKEELEKLYEFYRKLWYCNKNVYYRKKKINYVLNLTSTFLVVVGTTVGGTTMNPIILGTISGAGVILKTATELKNLQKNVENANVAFTSYAKILVDLRNFLRGEEWNKDKYLEKLKILDDMIIEMGLNWEKYLEKYKKEFKV